MEPGETSGPRAPALDALRGGALAGMALYHLSWDLAYFRLIAADFPSIAPMRIFSHSVAATFLAIAGASLALAHRDRFRVRAFARRLAIVAGAAALVTAATFGFARDEAIFFGILHCIAAASLLAAPSLGAPLWLAFVAAALAFVAPLVVSSPLLDGPEWLWLGLGTRLPLTLDWRPLLPWSGFVFLGLGLARGAWPRLRNSAFWLWRPSAWPGRTLAWAGRHSLALYLAHQPVLFALLFALTNFTGLAARQATTEFSNVCQRECVAGGGRADACAGACQCVVRGLQDAGLARAIARDSLDDEERQTFSKVVRSCSLAK